MSDDQNNVLTQYSSAPLDIDELKAMYEANPENINIMDCLAFKHYTNEQNDEALKIYKEIANIQQDNESAHYYMGNIYYRTKRLVAAMMEWKKVIALDKDKKLIEKCKQRIEAAMQQVRDLK